MALNLVFMGTPDFAVPALTALCDAGHRILQVYCQPPRPAGRGKKPRPGAVMQKAQAQGIAVRCPTDLRDAEEVAAFTALRPDAVVVVAYGQILPQAYLDTPRHGCLNIHASLLPRWRGAAPVQYAILAGDMTTGVCVIRMTAQLDTGPVLGQREIAIADDDDAPRLAARLSALGAGLIVDILRGLESGNLPAARLQCDEQATMAAKLTRRDGEVDWQCDGAGIQRRLRALAPWPGCWFVPPGGGSVDGVKILAGRVESRPPDAAAVAPGTLLDGDGLVACGRSDSVGRADAFRIVRAQRPGRAPVTGGEVFRALGLGIGDRLAVAAKGRSP